ncbi:MAG: inositol monophosphatase family protein [Actinobacteria bacterium]|nr:inositol monophosphatase family protein [Actinomycetota bacterium]
MSEANDLLELALSIGSSASEYLMKRPATFELVSKSTAIDIATQMDKGSEELIVSAILKSRPDDGIIAEEGSAKESKSGITWVIDPLDGTVNYLYGLPGWNVSIAAKNVHETLVGVVVAPTINSVWHASKGGGAFFNGHPIRCNDPIDLDRALIATGFAYDVEDRFTQVEQMRALVPLIRDMRRNGAAAVDLCHVAMGALDAYFESGLKEWDLAAGALIATEAGAIVTTQVGLSRPTSLAAGPHLHKVLRATLAI